MADVTHPDDYRALSVYEDVPAGCKVVMVIHAGFEPHLRIGEFAVVDTSDKAVQNGELSGSESQTRTCASPRRLIERSTFPTKAH